MKGRKYFNFDNIEIENEKRNTFQTGANVNIIIDGISFVNHDDLKDITNLVIKTHANKIKIEGKDFNKNKLIINFKHLSLDFYGRGFRIKMDYNKGDEYLNPELFLISRMDEKLHPIAIYGLSDININIGDASTISYITLKIA